MMTPFTMPFIISHIIILVLYSAMVSGLPQKKIHSFETLRANLSTFHSKTPCQQKLQHFWITFDTIYRLDFIISFIDNLALMIGKYYPTCYAIHEDQSFFHAHFVISTTGYSPSQPFLINTNWSSYIKKIIRFAKKYSIILKEMHKNA